MENEKGIKKEGESENYLKTAKEYLNEKKFEEAIKFFEKSIEQTANPESLFQMAQMYEKGLGVEKNEKKAFELFEKSSNFGNLKGKYILAEKYKSSSSFLKTDFKKSFQLFKECEENGDLDSIHQIGKKN